MQVVDSSPHFRVRKIQDTGRQGRWHNTRYRVIATELGLDVVQAPSIGWSVTTFPASTAASYAAVLDDLANALVAWRRPERHGTRPSNDNGVSAKCPCGRRIRVTESVLAAGPITCGLCHGNFAA